MRHINYILLGLFMALPFVEMQAQQDPQYTQYMYNTQVINPAYAGNREMLSLGLLYRTQWVGVEGAPKTATFSVNSPVGRLENMGLGLSVVHDEIGPATQTDVAIDYSYSIPLTYKAKLSFGVKAGVDVLDVDFTKLNIYNPSDPLFQNNIDNRWQPKIGAGLYVNTDKWYVGLSVPNFLETKHFDRSNNSNFQSVAAERMHFFLIGGYVFDLSDSVRFKPATMLKAVQGAPLQWDVSANFLFHNKLTLGAAWRWDAALSAMAGFQISPGLFIGVGYDYQLTDIEKYSDGSYEIMLRFDIVDQIEKILTPRFF